MEKKTRRTGGQSKPQPQAEPTQVEEVVMEAPKPQAKKQAPVFKRTIQENGYVFRASKKISKYRYTINT